WIALLILLIFSDNALFQSAARSWEPDPVSPEMLSAKSRTIVVLGGMISENKFTGLPRFSQSADRFWQGYYLLKTGVGDTLLISGGLGSLFDDKQLAEGELWRIYLERTKLMDENIIIESTSRNTYENAVNSAVLFEKEHRIKRIILVTSAFHIPRARACFEKQGFDVEVFPADPLAGVRPLQWNDYVIPSAGVLEAWGIFFREWAGIVMYKMNGYI
ncbi:MAG: YdcF family protein, partial [Bacteroidota bacterium]